MQNRVKKFALIGTSCIGKTSLLEDLVVIIPKEFNKKTVISPEAARYYFSTVHVRKPFSYRNQSAVQSLAKKFEQEAEAKNPDVILCDRSVFDAVAYVHAVGQAKDAQKLHDRMRDWLRTYDHLFLLDPKDVPYKKDEIRQESAETRQMFHDSFALLLGSSNLPFTLISGTERERVNQMLSIIKKSFQNHQDVVSLIN